MVAGWLKEIQVIKTNKRIKVSKLKTIKRTPKIITVSITESFRQPYTIIPQYSAEYCF